MKNKKNIFWGSIFLIFVGLLIISKITDISFIGIEAKENEVWSIGIYRLYENEDGLKVVPYPQVNNPVLTAKDITDRKVKYVADPFLVYENENYYMFFEVLSRDNGDIGLAISKDGINWKYEKIVLDEPFHLSYPFVFKLGNKYYMIPESYEAHSIRLYEAINFPYEWEFVKTLLEGQDFVDPTILYYKDKWWIFTSDTSNSYLYIYYADNLEGPWFEHQGNPVIKRDNHRARCGGNIINIQDKLIRIAQDDFHKYGNSVRAFEILKLTIEEYQEIEIANSTLLTASGEGWNRDGMHHLSTYKINEKEYLACVDGKKVIKKYKFYGELPFPLGKFLSKIIKE